MFDRSFRYNEAVKPRTGLRTKPDGLLDLGFSDAGKRARNRRFDPEVEAGPTAESEADWVDYRSWDEGESRGDRDKSRSWKSAWLNREDNDLWKACVLGGVVVCSVLAFNWLQAVGFPYPLPLLLLLTVFLGGLSGTLIGVFVALLLCAAIDNWKTLVVVTLAVGAAVLC